jgi:hypothetical protein
MGKAKLRASVRFYDRDDGGSNGKGGDDDDIVRQIGKFVIVMGILFLLYKIFHH